MHKKAKKILPLGGHVERNELPEEACIREAWEESGLEIKLFDNESNSLKKSCDLVGEKLLVKPVHMVLGEIAPGHCHMDFVFYAIADTYQTNPAEGESRQLKWYSKEELKKADNIQENVLDMANEALNILGIV